MLNNKVILITGGTGSLEELFVLKSLVNIQKLKKLLF